MTTKTPDPRSAHAPSHRFTRGALELLEAARHGVAESTLTLRPADRYAQAHLAALRAAAAVLATRAQPTRRARQRGPRSAWVLLAEVSPELGEWAGFFAAGAGKRAAAEAGLDVVTAREADDLLRDVETFVALVEDTLGVPHQAAFSLGGNSPGCPSRPSANLPSSAPGSALVRRAG
jgi:hypothetical protein